MPPLVRAGGGHPASAGLPVLGRPGGLFCPPVLGQVDGLCGGLPCDMRARPPVDVHAAAARSAVRHVTGTCTMLHAVDLRKHVGTTRPQPVKPEEQPVRAPLPQAPESPRTPHATSSERCRLGRVSEKARSEQLSRLVAQRERTKSVKRASGPTAHPAHLADQAASRGRRPRVVRFAGLHPVRAPPAGLDRAGVPGSLPGPVQGQRRIAVLPASGPWLE